MNPWWIAVGFFSAAFVFFGMLLVRSLVADLAHRGEPAEAPLPDPDPFDQEATRPPVHRPVRVVSREYPATPAERRFAKDIENFLRSHHGA